MRRAYVQLLGFDDSEREVLPLDHSIFHAGVWFGAIGVASPALAAKMCATYLGLAPGASSLACQRCVLRAGDVSEVASSLTSRPSSPALSRAYSSSMNSQHRRSPTRPHCLS